MDKSNNLIAAAGRQYPSFAAGMALSGTALRLVSVPKLFAAPIRILGVVNTILFNPSPRPKSFGGEQLRSRCRVTQAETFGDEEREGAEVRAVAEKAADSMAGGLPGSKSSAK